MAACMILLRCVSRQAASCRSGNWKSPNFVGWGNWKAIRSMSTVGISSSAAAAPWLMLPPSLEDEGGKTTTCYNLYSPVDKKVTRVSNRRSSITIGGGGGEEELEEIRLESAVLAGSSRGWLAVYKDWYNVDPSLYNPISDRQIKLPPIDTIPQLAGEEKLKYCPEKLILSCPPDESSSCRAVLRYGPRSHMAVCCPGQSTEWTPFGAPFHEGEALNDILGKPRMVRCYEDFVYSARREQLFCVTEYGDLEAWDIGDPSSPKLNWKTNDIDMDHDEKYPWPPGCEVVDEFKQTCSPLQYLVFSEHSDRLFFVRRYLLESGNCEVETMDINVYEIIIGGDSTGGGELRYMKCSLDGMAFFIGEEADGLVVESPGAVGLLPDSIYYTDRIEVRTPSYECGGHHLVVFDYANKTFSPCHLPGLDVPPKRDYAPAPLWFTPSPSITTPLSNE